MSEQLFELLLHSVDEGTDIGKVKATLANFLKVDADSLEKTLVKIKLFHGQSQALKKGLKEAEAKRIQVFLTKVGLQTTVEKELALEPIKYEAITDSFECPACGAKNKVPEDEIQICSDCGIVKEKYEQAQARKKEEEEKLKQARQLEKELRSKTSVQSSLVADEEERREKELQKKLKVKQKKDWALVASVLLGLSVLGGGGYWYLNKDNAGTETITAADKLKASQAESGSAVGNEIKTQRFGSAEKAPVTEAAMGLKPGVSNDGSLDNMYEDLGNPYSEYTSFSAIPKVSLEDTPQYLKSIQKQSSELSVVDKSSINNISTIYSQTDRSSGDLPDFATIKEITNAMGNETLKVEISRRVAWDEMMMGTKSFDEYGTSIAPRPGEELKGVQIATRLIDLYIKDGEFFQAEKMAERLEDDYLQAVALKKIVESAVDVDTDMAELHRNKISMLTDKQSLADHKVPLILGMLSLANRALDDRAADQITQHKLKSALKGIDNQEKKFFTLVQLSEDHRETLHFKEAHLYAEQAHELIDKKVGQFLDKEKAYSSLAEQYLKLFEFDRAKALIAKMEDQMVKVALYQTVLLVQKQLRS